MSAITSTGSPGASTGTNNAFAALSSGDFLKVMLSELQNQDPLQPQDTSKLLEQLSSLRNVESQLTLQQSLQSLVTQSQISQAGGMIGKLVAGVDDGGSNVSGLVTS